MTIVLYFALLQRASQKMPLEWPEAYFFLETLGKMSIFRSVQSSGGMKSLLVFSSKSEMLLTWQKKANVSTAEWGISICVPSQCDIILRRCVFTVWLDVAFPSQVGILSSANTPCISAHFTSVFNLPGWLFLGNGITLRNCLVSYQGNVEMANVHRSFPRTRALGSLCVPLPHLRDPPVGR